MSFWDVAGIIVLAWIVIGAAWVLILGAVRQLGKAWRNE